mgnify:CR=1 FL=1
METKLETSAKGFHCFESEKLSLLTANYSTEIPKFHDVRAFLRFTEKNKFRQKRMSFSFSDVT